MAKKAASLIKPGTIVGVGTGSTACMAIEEFGKLKVRVAEPSFSYFGYVK